MQIRDIGYTVITFSTIKYTSRIPSITPHIKFPFFVFKLSKLGRLGPSAILQC